MGAHGTAVESAQARLSLPAGGWRAFPPSPYGVIIVIIRTGT